MRNPNQPPGDSLLDEHANLPLLWLSSNLEGRSPGCGGNQEVNHDSVHFDAGIIAQEPEETADSVEFDFAMDRRSFVQVLGAGLIIAVGHGSAALAQDRGGRGGGRGGGARNVAVRIHLANDGTITVLTGKIEMAKERARSSPRLRRRNCVCRSARCRC